MPLVICKIRKLVSEQRALKFTSDANCLSGTCVQARMEVERDLGCIYTEVRGSLLWREFYVEIELKTVNKRTLMTNLYNLFCWIDKDVASVLEPAENQAPRPDVM